MKAQEYYIRWQKYCLRLAHSEWRASQHFGGISTCHYNLQLCTWRQNCSRSIRLSATFNRQWRDWRLCVAQAHCWARCRQAMDLARSWSERGCFLWEVLTCHVQMLQEYFHPHWVWHPFHLSVCDVSFHIQWCEHAACFVKPLSTRFDYYRATPRNGKSRQWQRSTGVYKVYSW